MTGGGNEGTGARTILTDVDQVLLDWVGPFSAWAVANGWTQVGDLAALYRPALAFGMTGDEEAAAIAAFNDTDVLAEQPARPCASAAVPVLKAAGYDFVAITACGAGAARTRAARLASAFGFPWDRVEVVGLGASKLDVLRAYRDALGPCVWVEDSPRHALEGAEAGHRCFLVDHPYNAGFEDPRVTRVAGWGDVLEALEPRLAREAAARSRT